MQARDKTRVESYYKNVSKPLEPDDNFVNDDDFPMNSIIKSFVTYSKLKANFLSKSISSKDALGVAIKKLCGVKNIVSAFNKDKKGNLLGGLTKRRQEEYELFGKFVN